MKRTWVILPMLVFAGQLHAAPKAPKASWGKADVSFDDYRRDAVACGREGYYLDIAQTDDAQAFVRGSRELDAATEAGPSTQSGADAVEAAVIRANQYERIRTSVQPERRLANLKAVLQSAVDHCLIGRGYVKFALNNDQRHRLGKLAAGSQQRQSYLFSIASDPAVLASQRVQ